MQKAMFITKILLLGLILISCQAPSPEAARLSEEDKAAIRKASEKYVQSALASDWDEWIKVSTEDAVFMPPNQPALEGRAEIRAWGEASPPMTSFSLTPLEIYGVSSLAFVRGAYSFTFAVPDSEPITVSGKYIEIWEKQPDGAWRIIRGIWNTSEAAPGVTQK